VSALLAPLLSSIGHALVRASLVGAVLGLGVLAVRRPMRRISPAVQAWLWWLIAARLLLELAGAPALELAWLPAGSSAADSAQANAVVEQTGPTPAVASATPTIGAPAVLHLELDPASESRMGAWHYAGIGWVLAVAAGLGIGARRWWHLQRLLATSRLVEDPATSSALADVQETLGIGRPITIAHNEAIAAPLVVGWWKPRVLLPPGANLDSDELRLVLLHELEHVRRLDALRGWVPELARRLLFFHPLARLAAREFSLATEAACDAEVVRRGVAPANRYGALLVRFALTPRGLERFASALSFVGPSLNRRLEMLVQGSLRRHWMLAAALPLAVAVPLLATPLRLVAAAPEPATQPVAPLAPPSAVAPVAGERWAQAPTPPSPATPATPASPAMPPLAPLPALAAPALPPLPPLSPDLEGADWLVLIDGGTQIAIGASSSDRHRAERLSQDENRPILLLAREGRTWVVRDPAVISRVHDLFAEQLTAARQRADLAKEVARQSAEVRRQEARATREAIESLRRSQILEAQELSSMAKRDAQRSLEVEAQRMSELARQLANRQASSLGQDEEWLRLAQERVQAANEQMVQLKEELSALERQRAAEMSNRELVEQKARQAEIAARVQQQLDELEHRQLDLGGEIRQHSREIGRDLGREIGRIFREGLAKPYEADPDGRP